MTEFSIPHDLTPLEAGGMTVNERLVISGLFDAFYLAVKQKDEVRLRAICEKVHLGKENTDVLVETYINEK